MQKKVIALAVAALASSAAFAQTNVTIYGVVDVGQAESPRELRRLHYLREWSHDEQIKQIFP